MQFSINTKPSRAPKPPHKVFLFKKTDVETMQTDIKSLIYEFFERQHALLSVNDNWTFFRDGPQRCISKNVPSKMTKHIRDLPWINRQIKRALRKRDRLFKRALRVNNPESWAAFKTLRNKVSKLIIHTLIMHMSMKLYLKTLSASGLMLKLQTLKT